MATDPDEASPVRYCPACDAEMRQVAREDWEPVRQWECPECHHHEPLYGGADEGEP